MGNALKVSAKTWIISMLLAMLDFIPEFSVSTKIEVAILFLRTTI